MAISTEASGGWQLPAWQLPEGSCQPGSCRRLAGSCQLAASNWELPAGSCLVQSGFGEGLSCALLGEGAAGSCLVQTGFGGGYPVRCWRKWPHVPVSAREGVHPLPGVAAANGATPEAFLLQRWGGVPLASLQLRRRWRVSPRFKACQSAAAAARGGASPQLRTELQRRGAC